MLQRSLILFLSPTCCHRLVEIDVSAMSARGAGFLTNLLHTGWQFASACQGCTHQLFRSCYCASAC